ncbi:MAG TPA: phosphoribosylamine--glycine ligase [Hydrogenophilus thermoluteolus]|nr:phosphoribosylamine--glycine ligase [Hydrogenophilus thermoluteolus]
MKHLGLTVMVVGSGGREHALAWKLAQSPRVQRVFVAPGNPGTAATEKCRNLPANDIPSWIDAAKRHHVDLTVVGPEAPLAAGIVDAFQAEGLTIFGPTQAAAQLEASKEFAKAFMARHGIPTAPYATFSDPDKAHAYVDAQGAPIVIKADGLAAGKGVVVAQTLDEAHAAIDKMLVSREMGEAGARVVIEAFLEGEEASFIVIADGKEALTLATSQDHKRLLDGDQGPNTGGMGAYSPAPVVTPDVHARVMREIIRPTLAAMAEEGTPYVGFLYAGLMIAPNGAPFVVEFNCRMGDPETQPIMARLKSDLVDLIEAALEGRIGDATAEWDRRVALAVVLAAQGYPNAPKKGDPIMGLPKEPTPLAINDDSVLIFHAGTAQRDDGTLVTAGGRVLAVTALGDSVAAAQQRAYAVAEQIRFPGKQIRRDIGHRAIAKPGRS